MLREVDERAPVLAPCCCLPGVDDLEGREGGVCSCMAAGGGVRFRTRALLVSFVYMVYGALAIVAISVAASSTGAGPARAFAVMVATVTSSLHFFTSLFGMLFSEDGRKALDVGGTAVTFVVVSDWLIAAGLAVAACGIQAAGGRLEEVDLGNVLVSNILILVGQSGCMLKTNRWLDADFFDQTTGQKIAQSI